MNWYMANRYDDYIDFERELISLPDDGQTSIDIRLSFNHVNRTAYVTALRRNDDGGTRELNLGAASFDLALNWDDAIKMLTNPDHWVDHLPKELS